MPQSRRPGAAAEPGVSLRETLVAAGLDDSLAEQFADVPTRIVHVDVRRPFREPGVSRDDMIFVRSGIMAKYKSDASGRRQIVALRFPGEVILPREGTASCGVQAIVRSEVLLATAQDFQAILKSSFELQRFFWRLSNRDAAIGYEWLMNCGRRDSAARVAHLLCEVVVRSGVDVEHGTMSNPFTQQQIADITGQTPVNVNRVLAQLEKKGLIRRTGRQIAFPDWAELRRLASFQSAYLD